MTIFKDIPNVITKRVAATALIGVGCAVFGGVYYLYTADRIFLILSGCVFAASLYKSVMLYLLAREKRYDTVEGTCIGVMPRFIGKFKTVKIMNDEGIETTLYLGKNCKLMIGSKYRLYFKASPGSSGIVRSEYINAALATDMFLGCECADKHISEE